MFQKVKNFILDILFPVSCVACGKDDVWFCRDCLEKIPLRKDQVCPLCEKRTTPAGRVCFSCREKSALDGLLVATSYQNTAIASAVHCYKYRFAEKLHEPLGKILLRAYTHSNLPLPEIIIPVPLHPRRWRWRGFNQAQLLAEYLGAHLTPGFPLSVLSGFLIRRRHTSAQMLIKNYRKRKKNIQNAFGLNHSAGFPPVKPAAIENKRVLLIDDIATTGATLFECAKILKSAGAQEVFAAVVARQELKG